MSWEQLIAIRAEARVLAEQDRTRPLVDCPVCATLLETDDKGRLHCPWGDWAEATWL